jgi:hypothetical protein
VVHFFRLTYSTTSSHVYTLAGSAW